MSAEPEWTPPPLPPSQAARVLSRPRVVLDRRQRSRRWWRTIAWESRLAWRRVLEAKTWPRRLVRWMACPKLAKVLFRRIWLMLGPEVLLDGGEPSKQFEKVWLHQILLPYYEGPGRSVRVNGWSLRLGWCKPKVKTPLLPWLMPERRGLYVLDTDVDLDAELGYSFGRPLEETPQEVRSWGSSSPSESEKTRSQVPT